MAINLIPLLSVRHDLFSLSNALLIYLRARYRCYQPLTIRFPYLFMLTKINKHTNKRQKHTTVGIVLRRDRRDVLRRWMAMDNSMA